MPFEFRADNQTDDPELPADFAALGEQLQSDAKRLGQVYPACRPPLELMDALAKAPRRTWLRRHVLGVTGSAAAVLLVASLAVIAFAPRVLVKGSLDRAVVPETQPAVNTPAVPELVEIPAPRQATAMTEPAVRPISYHPAAAEFTGPELEGLLDLWQEQPQAPARIAF